MGGRRWTDAEDATIRKMVAQGTPHHEIGPVIGRTLDSVRDRAQNIGDAQREYGKLSEETRKKLSKGIRAHNLKRLAWLPDEYRAEYTKLVHRVGAHEAERRVRAKMSPFDRQMQAIRNGARLIEKPVYHSRPYDFTLGGVSSMEGT
jgi:hypothetical protein